MDNMCMIFAILLILIILWFAYDAYSKRCLFYSTVNTTGKALGLVKQAATAATEAAANSSKVDSLDGMEDKINIMPDEAMSYNDVTANVALPEDVFASHKSYIHDLPLSSQGATSKGVINSADNDVNVWAGLRRPNYRSSVAQSQAESRVVSSDYPTQYEKNNLFIVG